MKRAPNPPLQLTATVAQGILARAAWALLLAVSLQEPKCPSVHAQATDLIDTAHLGPRGVVLGMESSTQGMNDAAHPASEPPSPSAADRVSESGRTTLR
jgi:hypothetical protein